MYNLKVIYTTKNMIGTLTEDEVREVATKVIERWTKSETGISEYIRIILSNRSGKSPNEIANELGLNRNQISSRFSKLRSDPTLQELITKPNPKRQGNLGKSWSEDKTNTSPLDKGLYTEQDFTYSWHDKFKKCGSKKAPITGVDFFSPNLEIDTPVVEQWDRWRENIET